MVDTLIPTPPLSKQGHYPTLQMGKQTAMPGAMDQNQSWEEGEGMACLCLLDIFQL